MKKVWDFLKGFGTRVSLHSLMGVAILAMFNPTNPIHSVFFFGELPFPEEAYQSLKIKYNQQ